MKFDAAYLKDAAKQTGFDPYNVEKVLRLKELLREFLRHPFLKGKLVLKGGTGINVFLFQLRRLSVDIDLNYIGQVDRDRMQAERPELERAVEQIALGLGYRAHAGKNDWALKEFHLSFNNHAKRADHLQVEVNFLMRICALPPQSLKAIQLADEAPCEFPVLAMEELMAGKLKAMIERSHPRDLYDLYRFSQAGVNHDSEMLTKLTVLFASTLAHDLRSYTLDRYDRVKREDIERLLYPLLRPGDRPTTEDMTAAIRPLLASVLDHAKEKAYLNAMARGEYRPELLSPTVRTSSNGLRGIPPCSGRRPMSPSISHDRDRPAESGSTGNVKQVAESLCRSSGGRTARRGGLEGERCATSLWRTCRRTGAPLRVNY